MAKYQVFISFRGEDTRSGFISHFHSRLLHKKIETYIDYRLQKGDEIWPALLSAIEASKISVIVFSENYACSSWCLDELVHILRCRESGQVAVPVFYGVDPADVRKQSGSYGAALARFEGRFEEEVLRKWRKALTVAANIGGWDSKVYRLEFEFVDAIVEDILKRLTAASSSNNDAKGLIGIDQTVEEVITLLSIHSPKVLTVGIWGMGGVGKTTLAHFVFKKLSPQFEGSCFLANVREESGKQTFDRLEKRLVSELLEENDRNTVTLFHKDRLRRKRVLVVLDDVNDPEHLELLAGDDDQFGLGSRIIVTTRDAEVLRDRADEIFELKGLNFDNALKLFCLNAFKRSAPTTDDIRLSKKVVNYVGGIPLALKVLGSFLRSKRREKWDHELDKLKEVPNMKIYNVLKISFDGLDKMEQSIFLDIACCIKGHVSRNSLEYIVGGGDSFADIGIDSLIDKSLISIEGNALVMHDLVREMGQEIVRQQFVEEPGKRSRIWGTKDVSHVFKYSRGTAKIEGISLDTSEKISEVELSPIFYEGMHKLRLLNLDAYSNGVKLPLGLQYLPDTLTCLVWFSWPLKCIPTFFEPHKLAVLKMSQSNLEQLWSGVHDLANLRYINLSNSSKLTELPDLSLASKLESVNLSYCGNLRRFRSPLRFRVVDNVALLNQCRHKCNDWKCWNLGSLDLRSCTRIENFPEISGTVKKVTCGSSSIAEFPSSFWSLESLEYLDMSDCRFFKNLPSATRKLKSLKHLNLSKCSALETFLELPKSLVKSIESLIFLEELDLHGCTRLRSLPSNIWTLKSLKQLKLSSCRKLETFPEISEPMEHLEILLLERSGIRQLPSTIENLIGLQRLEMSGCIDLEILPPTISNLSRLREINLLGCSKLKLLPPLTDGLRSLTNLDLRSCTISQIPNGIVYLASLEKLTLSKNVFTSIPENFNQLRSLVTLEMCNCKNLKSLPGLPLSLQFFDASGCVNLEKISDSSSELARRWGENNSPKRKEFLYYDCSKLDQNMCNTIVTEFQIRSLYTAAISASKHSKLKVSDYAYVNVCCPGKKIPKWFDRQSEAQSLDVTLPSSWHNDGFLGVAVCAVVDGEMIGVFEDVTGLSCTICVKTNQGESLSYTWKFTENLPQSGVFLRYGGRYSSENLFMWYKYENYVNWHDVAELSLKFDVSATGHDQYSDYFCVEAGSCTVTSCGIRLLNLQDVERSSV